MEHGVNNINNRGGVAQREKSISLQKYQNGMKKPADKQNR